MPLHFGDGNAMVQRVEMTGKGEGFGTKIGLGSYRLAESWCHLKFWGFRKSSIPRLLKEKPRRPRHFRM